SQCDLKVVARKLCAAGAAIRRKLLVGPQRIVVSKAPRVIGAEISRVGFHCIKVADAWATLKAQVRNVEKVLMRERITNVYVKIDSRREVRVSDGRIGKRLNSGGDGCCLGPMAVSISSRTIAACNGA